MLDCVITHSNLKRIDRLNSTLAKMWCCLSILGASHLHRMCRYHGFVRKLTIQRNVM